MKISPLEKSNPVNSNDNLNAYGESGRDDNPETHKEGKKPRMHEKLYICNSKQMMTWTNNQRMLMM